MRIFLTLGSQFILAQGLKGVRRSIVVVFFVVVADFVCFVLFLCLFFFFTVQLFLLFMIPHQNIIKTCVTSGNGAEFPEVNWIWMWSFCLEGRKLQTTICLLMPTQRKCGSSFHSYSVEITLSIEKEITGRKAVVTSEGRRWSVWKVLGVTLQDPSLVPCSENKFLCTCAEDIASPEKKGELGRSSGQEKGWTLLTHSPVQRWGRKSYLKFE